MNNHRIVTFLYMCLTVQVVKAGRCHGDVLGVEDGLEGVADQVLILVGDVIHRE